MTEHWREQMCDLAASVWTSRKASPPEVRSEIFSILGIEVPEEQEDALKTLSAQEIQKILIGLGIDSDDCGDLCPECFALAGECAEACGQYEAEEDVGPYAFPTNEEGVQELLEELLENELPEFGQGRTLRWKVKSFKEDGVLTDNAGLVLTLGRAEYQITVVRSK